MSIQGLVGGKATQSYHGGADAALCVHLSDHYGFWEASYAPALAPGSVGENLTLRGLTEDMVCVCDLVRCGTVLAQVSGPRVLCGNQARQIGRADYGSGESNRLLYARSRTWHHAAWRSMDDGTALR